MPKLIVGSRYDNFRRWCDDQEPRVNPRDHLSVLFITCIDSFRFNYYSFREVIFLPCFWSLPQHKIEEFGDYYYARTGRMPREDAYTLWDRPLSVFQQDHERQNNLTFTPLNPGEWVYESSRRPDFASNLQLLQERIIYQSGISPVIMSPAHYVIVTSLAENDTSGHVLEAAPAPTSAPQSTQEIEELKCWALTDRSENVGEGVAKVMIVPEHPVLRRWDLAEDLRIPVNVRRAALIKLLLIESPAAVRSLKPFITYPLNSRVMPGDTAGIFISSLSPFLTVT